MSATAPVRPRVQEICDEQAQALYRRTDRLFAWLLVFQWLGGITAALLISPRAWAGSTSSVHPHVYVAAFLGGLIMLPPALLGLTRAGEISTRHTIAVGQALTSALLIHLTGGRIETHFHVFGSLAFLAFYRDWTVLVTASAVVAADHFLRGVFWPQSVYGVLAVSPWRWLEHAGWVLFEDAFLIPSCIQGRREMRKIAEHQADLEETNKQIEEQVRERTQELHENQLLLFHAAKLESVGRLAAGVAHEVKNPLAITLLGINYLESEVVTHDASLEPVVAGMKDAIKRADSVIRGLLDFASPRAIDLQAQDINGVLDQALLLVRGDLVHAQVEVHREYADDLPPVRLDTQKIQQVLVNLCVNSCQAMPEGGHLTLRSWIDGDPRAVGPAGSSGGPAGGGPAPEAAPKAAPGQASWVHVQVDDTGTGVPEDKLEKLFEPFFTTKAPGQGTGLGLSVSKRIMELHSAELRFCNRPEGGARATLSFPVSTKETQPCPSDASSLSTTR